MKDEIKLKIKSASKLITDVTFCSCFGEDNCNRPTIYIHHKRCSDTYYHCVHVSSDGLMVNSNGHHNLDLHDAMNEAVKIARYYLDL